MLEKTSDCLSTPRVSTGLGSFQQRNCAQTGFRNVVYAHGIG
jgi:hypothetical protein